MPSIKSERTFQKKHISRQKEKYLATDIREKVRSDSGYRYKVELVEKNIRGIKGYILDLGANTCGEAEYLVSKGYKMVASDISEVGLELSKQRTKIYGYEAPEYYSFDAHAIPFADNSFDCIIASEVLHHFENIDTVLSEIKRVLRKGGRLIALEPYAFNPYRRLSEVPHFFFTGSIERSFSKSQIRKIIEKNGLQFRGIEMVVIPPSEWKMSYQSILKNMKQKLYYVFAKFFPRIFGLLFIIAQKDGVLDESNNYEIKLICPRTGNALQKNKDGYICRHGEDYLFYPSHNDIPILISEDAQLLTQKEYEKL